MDGTIRQPVDELPHKRIVRSTERCGCALRSHFGRRNHVHVICNLKRLFHIMRNHQRGRTKRIVETAD